MSRVKRGAVAIKRRKKIFKLTKGFKGSHSTLFRTANQQAMKALKYSYVDGRLKKREFRKLWIRRINGSTRSFNITYSQFIHQLKAKNIHLNRKTISQLAILDERAFLELLSLIEPTLDWRKAEAGSVVGRF